MEHIKLISTEADVTTVNNDSKVMYNTDNNKVYFEKKNTAHSKHVPAKPPYYLNEIKGFEGIMIGHHDDTLVGYNWTEPIGDSDIHNVLGSYPMFMEFDLMGIELGREYYADEIKYEDIKKEAIRQYRRGGFIGFSWHMYNPYTDGSVYSLDSNTVPSILEDGTDANLKFMSGITRAIEFLQTIVDENGNQIPFIFRPFHECMNKSTMWWVSDQCTAEQYMALWQMTYDEFKAAFDDDILFCFSPTAYVISKEYYLERYPGDDYVDIFGIEEYQGKVTETKDVETIREEFIAKVDYNVNAACKLASAHDKICALTECGIYINQDAEFWSKAFNSILNCNIKYFCLWRNANKAKEASGELCYAPYVGELSESDFKTFCENDKLLKITL